MSQEVSKHNVQSNSSNKSLKVTLLSGGWTSSAGGLPTFNRELAIHLSQHPQVDVSFLVPDGHCTDEDKNEAQSFRITVVSARERPGWKPLEWLSAPPRGHKMDVVIGHGAKLGKQVPFIKDSAEHQNCKWVQVVHTAPEDLSKYKGYPDPISKGEEKHEVEVALCRLADLVVPVGPRLEECYSAYLKGSKRDMFPLIPGLFDREFGGLEQSPNENAEFKVLLCGRGDEEDFELKGYNIAAKAFTDHRLQRKPYHLLFVGAPEGKQEEVRRRLLQCGIAEDQLTVRKFVQSRKKMRDLLCEVNLAIMPSRSEAFGLVALEALSAGLPILVNSKSGFARALENIPFGKSCILDSNEPAKWAESIEGVRVRHKMWLKEIKMLRTSYGEQYSWKEQFENFVGTLWTKVHGSSTGSVKTPRADPPVQGQSAVAAPDRVLSGQQPSSDQERKGSGAYEEREPLCAQSLQKERKQKTSESTFDLETRLTVRIKIKTKDLNGEQRREFEEFLLQRWKGFNENNDISSAEGMGEFVQHLLEARGLLLKEMKKGCLEITVVCPTLDSLESLWNDYRGGQLNEILEKYLVTDEIKEKLNLENVRLQTTIPEEDYLMCKTSLEKVSDRLIRLIISTQDLDDASEEDMYEILSHNGQRYVKCRKLSGDVLEKGVEFLEYLTETLKVNLVYVAKSSLEIGMLCPNLESLEKLWNYHVSGHLSKVAERLLVTDEIKWKLNLETVRLTTTIEKENYLMCKKVLMEMAGAARSTHLPLEDAEPDQGQDGRGTGTSLDDQQKLACDSSPPQLSIKLPKPSDIHSTRVDWSKVELPVDVILLTAEEWEFISCFAYLDAGTLKSYSKEIGYVYFGSMGGGDRGKLKIALLQCSRGTSVPSGSLTTVKNAVRVLGPRAVFSVGACSGLSPERAKLGDVVVPSNLTTSAHRTPVSRNMGYLIKDMKYGWAAPLENRSDLEVRVDCDSDILSKELAASFGWRVEDIMKQYPKAIAVETEGEGVFAAAYDDNVEWTIVKGVASYGDLSQSSTKDWASFASTMAASLVASVLKDDVVLREWQHAGQGLAKMQKTKECSTREKPAESGGTCTGENAETSKDAFDLTKLIDQIRQVYIKRDGWLAPFPWCEGEFFFRLDDIFTRLKMVSREKTRGSTTDKVVEMSAIFQPHEECQNPISVLIEGKPGMGKTTYSNKVAYDWATKKPEEGNHFQNFQVVLLLRCRDIYSNLQDAIVDQILPVDPQERERDKFLEFIKHNQPNVLLVLDGLDELPTKDKLPEFPREFSAIIQGRSTNFSGCSLVVTARPEAGIAVRKSFDTLLEIEGFTLDDAIDFISKFFKKKGENLAQKLTEKVKRDKNLQELIANPLNTSLLCLLCEDLHGLLPENRTQLYVDIVQCVLRRYKEKKGLPVTCDDLIEEYKPQLLHLGRIALSGLHEDKMSFEEKQLANHASVLSDMGFLSVQPGSSKRRPCRHYAFLHKSFQELFAAYYLCCQLISQEISPDTLVADDRYFSELRQVLLFTCGMLAKPSPDTTMALIKSSAARGNVEGYQRKITVVVLECINECKKEESNFHVDLACAFGSFVTLTELYLSQSNLGKTGAAVLADALRTNTTLTRLYLSDNNLGETGAAVLADALRTNTTLTWLNLSHNNLGDTGAAVLADALRTNTTLTRLYLFGNELSEFVAKEILKVHGYRISCRWPWEK